MIRAFEVWPVFHLLVITNEHHWIEGVVEKFAHQLCANLWTAVVNEVDWNFVRRVVEELVFLLIIDKVGRLDHVLETTTVLKKLVDWLADHRVEEVLLYFPFSVDMEVVISIGNFAAILIEFR